jgi:hypothetical protein
MIRVSLTLPQITLGVAEWAPKNKIRKVVTLVSDYGPGIDAERTFRDHSQQGQNLRPKAIPALARGVAISRVGQLASGSENCPAELGRCPGSADQGPWGLLDFRAVCEQEPRERFHPQGS